VIVRRATAADLDAVADLDWRALHEPFIAGPRREERRAALMAVWPGFLDAQGHLLDVAEASGVLVGFAAVRVVVGEAELDAVAVEPEARRAGRGKELLVAVIDALRADGVARVGLEVRAGNAPARRLYERLGFVQEGVRRGYYESGDDALLYGLALR
jgi:ribosomal-protein-alanine N-acetyltransferase